MQVDMAAHLGARAGGMGEPLAQAEAEYREEYHPTPAEIGRFRTYYIIGQINDRLRYLQADMHYRSRDELNRMLHHIDSLASGWGYGADDAPEAKTPQEDASE